MAPLLRKLALARIRGRAERTRFLLAAAAASSFGTVLLDLVDRPLTLRTLTPLELGVYGLSVALTTFGYRSLLEALTSRHKAASYISIGLLSALAATVTIQHDFALRYGVDYDTYAAASNVAPFPPLGPFRARLGVAPFVPFAFVLLLVATATLAVKRAATPRRFAVRALVRALLAFVVAPLVFGAAMNFASYTAAPFSPQALVSILDYGSGMGAELAGGYYRIQKRYPSARNPLPVPPIARRNDGRGTPNLVLVITESVRARDYGEDGVASPRASRVEWKAMHSLSSSTAISTMVLFSGYPVTASREEAHTVPLLWEYARAAGYHTAFYSGHNLLFGNNGTWLDGLPLDREENATALDPRSDMRIGVDDAMLLTLALGDFRGALPEPFVAVIHLSNTHFPYKIDPNETAYPVGVVPGEIVAARYAKSLPLQKARVEGFMNRLRGLPAGARTAVLFVSDHGEQFYEHGSFSHTHSLHEEETHVPAWLDAPRGILSEEAWQALDSSTSRYVTHGDVLPTMLDVLGIEPRAIAPFGERMPGRSLLRTLPSTEVRSLASNCTRFYACSHPSYAATLGPLKLIAPAVPPGEKLGADGKPLLPSTHQCFDVASDPGETRPLPDAHCASLVPALAPLEAIAREVR